MPGLIRDETEIKVLVLYILARLPEPVSLETIAELCGCDENVTYFGAVHCVGELVKTGHIAENINRYAITDAGRRDGAEIADSLPYSLRMRAERLCTAYCDKLERASTIKISREVQRRGGFVLDMQLSDSLGEIMRLRLPVPNVEAAAKMEAEFQNRAEGIFNDILGIFFKTDKQPSGAIDTDV